VKPVALLLVATLSTGCATATTSGRVEETLESALPGCRFERDTTLVLGRTSLSLLRWLSGVAGDQLDEDTLEILHGVRRIEVSSSRAAHECKAVGTSPLVSRQLAAGGWHAVIAAVEDEGELSWVFTREGPDGRSSGMLVIALDHEELEVVRLDGDIDRMLVAAVGDDPSTVLGLADQ
jgi:hypothetical protein